MVGNSPTGWGTVSRSFHWILGLTIIAMIAHGWWMNHITARPDRFLHRSIHSDIGYVVLLLTAIRLIWRSVNPVPVLPDDMVRRLRIAARATHWALYLATILVSILGWAHSGARDPNYASWFGLFDVPQITSPDRVAALKYEEQHILFAYVLLALIMLHVAAAVWHHFIRRDQVAIRMIRGVAG